MKLLVFSGTTEGRVFSKKAVDEGFDVTVSVATDYGAEIQAEEAENLKIQVGRLTEQEMEKIFCEYDAVIDATHPYAEEVSKNIKKAAESCEKPHFRFLRDECGIFSYEKKDADDVCVFDSVSELCEELCFLEKETVIFNSCGSKEISCFTKIPEYKKRLFVRVLPSVDSIKKCLEAGLPQKNIIAMQGPFSVTINEAMFKEVNASVLVTKMSGKNGGYDEKIIAARNCNMKIYAVKPPEEKFEQIFTDYDKIIEELRCVSDFSSPRMSGFAII